MQRWLVHFCHVTKILIADWLLAEVTLITIDPLSWDQSNRISSWDKIQSILKSQQTNIWMRVCWDIILFHGSCKSGFHKRFIRCVNTKRRAHVLRAIWTPSCRRCAYVNPCLDARVYTSSFGRYHVNACTAFFERYCYLEDARMPCVCFGRYLRVALCMI